MTRLEAWATLVGRATRAELELDRARAVVAERERATTHTERQDAFDRLYAFVAKGARAQAAVDIAIREANAMAAKEDLDVDLLKAEIVEGVNVVVDDARRAIWPKRRVGRIEDRRRPR